MKKKVQRKRKSRKPKTQESGEQLDLIDVSPKNAGPMVEAGRLYIKALKVRLKSLAEEVKQKNKIREFAREANLPRLKNGTIRFTYKGVTICITPRDEKVTVEDEADKD